MTDTSLIKSYSLATRILGPLTPLWVKRRMHQGKEDPERADERHGIAGRKRPKGSLVWMHAASVGESQMLLPLVSRLLEHDENLSVLMTTGTVTSAEMMAARLPARAIHQYVPLDYPAAVAKFLDHWTPDLAIWTESEIWPNLIRETKKRGVNMALLNARMSANSIDGWNNKAKASGMALLGAFDLILTANQQTADGLSLLLEKDIEMAGNLKDAAPPLPVDKAELKELKSQLSRRPVWCAASTHAGEDEIVLDAHLEVLDKHKRAFLILAPRHPERGDDIRALMKQRGLSYISRSSHRKIKPETQVLLYDTIGEMGLAYSLSKISFVCGSILRGLSGHNPLEPARMGNAVLTGVHISSFADTYMGMLSFDAARRILVPEMIGQSITELMSSKEDLKALQDNAKQYSSSRDAVLDYVWKCLVPLLPKRRS